MGKCINIFINTEEIEILTKKERNKKKNLKI